MAQFWLKIIASNGEFYSGWCQDVTVPAMDGETGILAHHEAMILAIREGVLKFKDPASGQEQCVVVGRGIVQAANNRVTVIVDTAERPEDIDAVRAREALERAQEQLRQKQSIVEYKMSQASMARALSRLRAKEMQGL